MLLDYIGTQEEAVLTYNASPMVVAVHSDASYLSEPKARSRAGGHFFMSSDSTIHRTMEQNKLKRWICDSTGYEIENVNNNSGSIGDQVIELRRLLDKHHPTKQKSWITQANLLKNTRDVDFALKIYGPSVALLKGKTVCKTAPVMRQDVVEVPREIRQLHKRVTLSIDIFLSTVSHILQL
jgi:hypothetical protein